MSATSEPGGLQRAALGARTLAYRCRGTAGAPILWLGGPPGEGAPGAPGVLDALAVHHDAGRPAEGDRDGAPTALGALADAYRLYLPEAPDGLSADAADLLADFVGAVVPAGKAHVVGIAAGATVAFWLALRRPAVVERLVVIAPTTAGGSPTAGESLPGRDDALMARLAEIEAPVLVLFGTEDALLGAAVPRLYRARLAHGQVTFVYRAGHDVGADRPAAVAGLVDEFLTYGEGFVRNHGATGYMRVPEGKAPSGRALAGRLGAER